MADRRPRLISIVIPTFNEADTISALLAALGREVQAHEVILSDGGSSDNTVALARAGGARIVEGPAGRGGQIARGAAVAGGDAILILHADSIFPAGGLAAIADALAEPGVAGGNFRVLFDGPTGFARWLTGFYAWFRRFGLYYGDSAVFVRRSVYDRLGGVRPVALMEDFDFNWRLERHGGTVCIDEPPLVTSSRRFAGRHPVAIFFGWVWIHLLYFAGTSGERMAAIYDSTRQRRLNRSP